MTEYAVSITLWAVSAVGVAACPNPSLPAPTFAYSGTMLDSPLAFQTNAFAGLALRACGINAPGYAGATPNLILDLSGLSDRTLILDVSSSCDTTLLVHTATGRWNFNDDGEEDIADGDLSPYLALYEPSDLAGTVAIWIGSYAGETCPASIVFQTRQVPATDADGPDRPDNALVGE